MILACDFGEREPKARAVVTWQSRAWIQGSWLYSAGGGSLCFTLASGVWEETLSFNEMKMDPVLPWRHK